MGISDEHITIAKTALSLLSWKRLLKVAAIALIAIVLVLGWLARGLIFHDKPAPIPYSKVAVLVISPVIKDQIDGIVKKDQHILAMSIVTINFQKNIRTETYMSIDNVPLQAIYDRFMNNKVVPTALFDDNKVNNNRIIRLINGEFVCVPYREATAYKYAPDGEQFVSTVCAIGIPPSYGEFSGILTVYLKDKPDKALTEQLFLLSRDISLRIYDDNKVVDETKSQH